MLHGNICLAYCLELILSVCKLTNCFLDLLPYVQKSKKHTHTSNYQLECPDHKQHDFLWVNWKERKDHFLACDLELNVAVGWHASWQRRILTGVKPVPTMANFGVTIENNMANSENGWFLEALQRGWPVCRLEPDLPFVWPDNPQGSRSHTWTWILQHQPLPAEHLTWHQLQKQMSTHL